MEGRQKSRVVDRFVAAAYRRTPLPPDRKECSNRGPRYGRYSFGQTEAIKDGSPRPPLTRTNGLHGEWSAGWQRERFGTLGSCDKSANQEKACRARIQVRERLEPTLEGGVSGMCCVGD